MLSRMVGETIMIGELHAVTVLKISPDSVRLLVISGQAGSKPKTVQLARDQFVRLEGMVQITIVDIRDDKVRIGINCASNLNVHRLEVWEALKKENQSDGDEGTAGSRVPRPTKPNPPSTDVRLDEPKAEDEN